MPERRDLLLVEGGADRDRKMAGGVQHAAATLVAKSNFTAYGCDVNSLIGTGTKTRADQVKAIYSHLSLEKDAPASRCLSLK